MTTKDQLASYLLEISAIKLQASKPFTWASGLRSPIYCDNRITLAHPEIRSFIKVELAEIARQLGDFDGVAGVATAGIAHGALMADYLSKPFVYVRSKPKGHGRENLIEGDLNKLKRVVVVEDLISTGGSSIQAVEALRSEGTEVIGVVAIFSYSLAIAKKSFEKANCPYLTISDYPSLVMQAAKSNFINNEEKKILEHWNNDPQAWSDTFNKEK